MQICGITVNLEQVLRVIRDSWKVVLRFPQNHFKEICLGECKESVLNNVGDLLLLHLYDVIHQICIVNSLQDHLTWLELYYTLQQILNSASALFVEIS